MTYNQRIVATIKLAALSLGVVAVSAGVAVAQLQFDRTPFSVPKHASPKGSAAAPFVVVEFSDYECPFCNRHVELSLKDIFSEFVDTGKVQYLVLNLPLEQLHAGALKAAMAAECAGKAGKFWDMHDLLFRNQNLLRTANYGDYATALNLDTKSFERCMAESDTLEAIKSDTLLAERMGVQGTPTFVFGELRNGTVYPLQKFSGAAPFPVFQSAFEDLLSGRMRTMIGRSVEASR